MRIHLVGADYIAEPWRFEADVAEAITDLGHELVFTNHRGGNEWRERLAQPADLLLVLKGETVWAEDVRRAPCPKVLWFPDDLTIPVYQTLMGWFGPAYDRVYGISVHDLLLYRRCGVEARWLPLACNPRLHRTLDVEKVYDIGMCGSMYPNRRMLKGWLEEHGFSVTEPRPPVYGEEMVRFLNQCRIVLNLSVVPGNMAHRIFEALGCGAFLMTDHCDGLESILSDGIHLCTYGLSTIVEWLRYYLAHEAEREAIARAGQAEVYAKHTVTQRIQKIIEDMEGE